MSESYKLTILFMSQPENLVMHFDTRDKAANAFNTITGGMTYGTPSGNITNGMGYEICVRYADVRGLELQKTLEV